MNLSDFLAATANGNDNGGDSERAFAMMSGQEAANFLAELMASMDTDMERGHSSETLHRLHELSDRTEYGRARNATPNDDEDVQMAMRAISAVRDFRQKGVRLTDVALNILYAILQETPPDSPKARFFAPIAHELLLSRDDMAAMQARCEDFAKLQAALEVGLFRLEHMNGTDIVTSWEDPGKLLAATNSATAPSPSSSADDAAPSPTK